MRSRSTILLTGFGPFPGTRDNISALLASKLAHLAARRFPGHRVVARTLPTEWDAGPASLARAYARERPRLALHFGVSGGAAGFVIETVARNTRASLADAKGVMPPSLCICEKGPELLAVAIPARAVVDRLSALGLPVVLSEDAGAYLCNTVFYEALAAAERLQTRMDVGFVHIPARMENPDKEEKSAATPFARELRWEDALRGGLEIIRVCLGRPPSKVKRR